MVEAETFMQSHIWQWRERLIKWLVPRLAGTDAEKETSVDMVFAALSQAHGEGLADAAYIVERMRDTAIGDRAAVLNIAANAIRKLAAMNEKSDAG